ncbi:MAG TPA: hypothetical protein VFX19_03155 [Dehalococcoidia bacterium]|jgi:hypothetical protein|nr:hypothetical protein [Dehalococcoidia bacterium]
MMRLILAGIAMVALGGAFGAYADEAGAQGSILPDVAEAHVSIWPDNLFERNEAAPGPCLEPMQAANWFLNDCPR